MSYDQKAISLGEKNPKGLKHDSQNRKCSPMHEGRQP